ncbi:MAG TPA: outer membrane beta-barrel protein, partial [Flavisolibacter sp.]|nr:outer membrane beta-barrel protein [Flavisolibacter sp.]
MKKLFSCLCFLPFAAFAQDFHFSFRLGASSYTGDLAQHAVNTSGIKPMFSLGARYDLSEHLTARTYFSFLGVGADDKNGTASMKARNLNFKTKLFDWELTAQYNIFNLNDKWWTPYVFAGGGIFHFNPYTTDAGGDKVFL